jgi:hypothetical protein
VSTTTEKIKLADAVLKVRELQTEKLTLLLKSAESWDEKSRDWSTSTEIRQLNADRARRARSEARELAKELGLP